MQSPKALCRKRPAPEGSRALSEKAPPGSPAVAAATSEKTITYSSFRHDKGDVDMHSPYNKMPSHFAACFNKPERGELPRKLAKAFGYAAPNREAESISVMSLQSLQTGLLNRPTTEAYRALRLQVLMPGTWISKAWIESGEPAIGPTRCASLLWPLRRFSKPGRPVLDPQRASEF